MLRRSPRLIRTVSFVAILAMSAALSFGLPAATVDSNLTVGEFLLQYARTVHLTLPQDATPEIAMAALQAARAIPGGEVVLGRTLTHGDVIRLGRAAGLKITSSTPEKSFRRAEADMFFETFSGVLSAYAGTSSRVSDGNGIRSAADSSAPDHANLEKGKKKGRPFQSSSEPQ